MTNIDKIAYLLFGILLLLFLVALLIRFLRFADGFSCELRYLNTEIRRTRGSQQQYWIRRRRRLWLSLLPFVRY